MNTKNSRNTEQEDYDLEYEDFFEDQDPESSLDSEDDLNPQTPWERFKSHFNFTEKQKKQILLGATIGLAILLIIYGWGVYYYHSHYLPYTQINGVDVGGKTAEEALQLIDDAYFTRSVEIVAETGTDTVYGSEIDLTFNNTLGDLGKLIKDQDSLKWQLQFITRKQLDLHSEYNVNETKLMSVIRGLPIVSGPNIVYPKDATISYDGNEYTIDPAVDGDLPDVDLLSQAVVNALVTGTSTINLAQEDLYDRPEVTQDNENLIETVDKLNTAIKASITLTFPTENVVINKDVFEPWLEAENDEVIIKQDEITNYVAALAQQFDTYGDNISFLATSGVTYNFTNNAGWQLDQEAEIEQLSEQILSGTVTTEEPEWSRVGTNNFKDSISGTYIEIDLTNQFLWFYKNNILESTSSIVSGNPTQGEATTAGIFAIQAKNTDVNLVVYYPDGTVHNVTVEYWLPYTNHYGLESASFRSSFGGDIYKTQGTDGDIDIPVTAARTLYNTVDVGTPVVIYR